MTGDVKRLPDPFKPREYPAQVEVHVYRESRFSWWANVYFPERLCTDMVGRYLGSSDVNLGFSRRAAIAKAKRSIANRERRVNGAVLGIEDL